MLCASFVLFWVKGKSRVPHDEFTQAWGIHRLLDNRHYFPYQKHIISSLRINVRHKFIIFQKCISPFCLVERLVRNMSSSNRKINISSHSGFHFPLKKIRKPENIDWFEIILVTAVYNRYPQNAVDYKIKAIFSCWSEIWNKLAHLCSIQCYQWQLTD